MLMASKSTTEGELLGAPAGVSRRGLFRLGTAFVAALAALSSPRSVSASPFCCDLARQPPYCSSCPPGYTMLSWYCTWSGSLCQCFECTTGVDCMHGDWACSNYWCTS
jgi:hypothetical protein